MDDADIHAQFEAMKASERTPRPPLGRSIFRHAFAPAFLLLLIAPWTLNGGHTPMEAMLTLISVAMLCTWMAEQLYPRVAAWNVRLFTGGLRGWSALARDLFYLLVLTRATAFLVTAADPSIRAAMEALHAPAIWPAQAPFAVRALLAFFAMELFAYWLHRAAHRSRVLWQFHSTHHVLTELNALKAVRTHPVDNLFFHLARTAPLLLIGAGPEEITASIYFGALLGILAHANLELSGGVLGLVVNLPRFHAVHHSAELDESDANFGCHTVLWDRVFGTFRGQARAALVVGVAPVGPRSLWRELVWPFYRWVTPPADPPAPAPVALLP